MNIALIVFAGKGTRINSKVPKQFVKVNNKNIVAHTISVFDNHPQIDGIVLVTSKDYVTYTENMVFENRFQKIMGIVEGGETRQHSVRNGLDYLKINSLDNVLIHDGDRPLVSEELITKAIKELKNHSCVVPIIKSEDEIEGISNSGRKCLIDGVNYDIQTPQCFKFEAILSAHHSYQNIEVSDDASLIELDGGKVFYIQGDPINFKITTDQDLDFFKKFLLNNKDNSK